MALTQLQLSYEWSSVSISQKHKHAALTSPQHGPPRLGLIQSGPRVLGLRAPTLAVAGQSDQVTRLHITVDGAVRRRGPLWKKTKNTTTGRRSQFVRQLYVLGVNRSAFLRGRVTGFEVWGLDMFMFTGSLKYVTRLYGMYCVVRTFHRSASRCQFCNSIIASMFLEFCNRASHNEARVQQLHLVAINKMLPHLFITWLLIMQAGFMWCFIPQI